MTDRDGQLRTLEADSVLVALPLLPNTTLCEQLKARPLESGRVPELHSIGDSGQPGLIIDAIAAGFEIGRTV